MNPPNEAMPPGPMIALIVNRAAVPATYVLILCTLFWKATELPVMPAR
jgi:hypothetical protein